MAECPDNLKPYRFKPGQSGNPAGPGKRLTFESWVAKILDEKVPRSDTTKREALARVFVDAMLKRNGQMIREYLLREWPAVQKHEVELPAIESNALEAALDRLTAGYDPPTIPEKSNGKGAA